MDTAAPAVRKAAVESFLVKSVDKTVAPSHTAIWPFLVFLEAHQLSFTCKRCAVLFNEFLCFLDPSGDHCGRELDSSHTGDFEEKAVWWSEGVQLVFDHLP